MKSHHQRFLLLAAVVLTYIWITRFFMPFPADFEDSYIMHRYVQHTADGFPYEWNRDAGTVQGMTGIAWVALVSLFSRLTHADVIDVNAYAGLAFSVLTLLAMYSAVARRCGPRDWWLAVCPLVPVVSSPFFARASGNGLETSLTMFFVALSIYLLAYCRPSSRPSISNAIRLGVFSGLTVLVRPDLPLFPLTLFVAATMLSTTDDHDRDHGAASFRQLLKDQFGPRVRQSLVLIVSAVAAALLALALARMVTGTALPLAAKLKFALTDLLLGRLPGSQYRFILGFQFTFLNELMPLVLLAVIAACFSGWRILKPYLPIYCACAVYFGYLFTVLPIMDVAYRFQLPVLIGLSFAVAHFAEFALRANLTRKRATTLVVAITLLLAANDVSPLFSGRKEAELLKTDHASFEVIGEALRPLHGISIASPEAGKLAFFSDKKFFDTIGLNDRFVATHKTSADYPAQLAQYLQTDFGMPDVYIRPLHPQIDPYAFLEIIPGFRTLYRCNSAQNAAQAELVICVLNRSPHAGEIAASLNATELGISVPDSDGTDSASVASGNTQ